MDVTSIVRYAIYGADLHLPSELEAFMNRFLFLLISFVLLNVTTARAEDWHETKGEHFIVYSSKSAANGTSFAEETARIADRLYNRIASDLGYARYSEFWTWDNRVKIYLYADHAGYLASGEHPQWSHGAADYAHKQIISYVGSSSFLETVLPHEVAHLIFRDYIGFRNDVPLWLDEGVAQWAEEKKRQQLKDMARRYYEGDSLVLLSDILPIDVRTVVDSSAYNRAGMTKAGKSVIVAMPGKELVARFYVQSASVVGFLIERYGSGEFTKFCRELRDGKSIQDAVRSVYGTSIPDIESLEREWRAWISRGGS